MRTPQLVLHQTRLEQRSFWRNPQAFSFTFAMPVFLLVVFGAIAHKIPGHIGPRPAVLLVPGFMAFGIIVAAYGNLASTITLLRSEGVLKRIRSTPMQPAAYIASQILSAVVSSFILALTCVGLGAAIFRVTPLASKTPLLVVVLTLGVASFASLGLAVTAAIRRADAAGPVTNATYIPLAIISGTFSDNLVLPNWLSRVAGLFPIKAFTDALRACYNPLARGGTSGDLTVLALWAIAGILLTRRYFRWNP
jgi:ABC-2 type transport system permease protein